MSTTVQIKSVPTQTIILIHSVNGTTFDTPVRGGVHKAGSLYSVRCPGIKGVEFKGDTKVTYSADPTAVCATHNEALRQRPGGIVFCPSCYRDSQKAYRARKRDGVDGMEARKAAKAARLERVIEKASIAERTREQMIGASIRTAATSLAAAHRKGSLAKHESYIAARLTSMVEGYGVSVEDAANWAGIPAWTPTSWTQHRKAFAKVEAEAA